MPAGSGTHVPTWTQSRTQTHLDVLPCRGAASRPRQAAGPFVVEKREAGLERYAKAELPRCRRAGGLGVSLRVTVTACARGHALPTCPACTPGKEPPGAMTPVDH